jgi:hypothetical protein
VWKLWLFNLLPGAAILKANIDDTRQMIAGLQLSKNIPIGNSDAGSYFNTAVLSDVDYGVRISSIDAYKLSERSDDHG